MSQKVVVIRDREIPIGAALPASAQEQMQAANIRDFELFLYVHRSCPGFTQVNNAATCTTHNKSASGPEGYIAK